MKGFTLIELIVTMTIIVVVTGLFIANYTRFNDQQVLKQAGLKLRNDFKLVQTKALSGQKTEECDQLIGWRVVFVEDSYTYEALCTNGASGASTPTNLPGGITFATIPAPILFKVVTGGVAIDQAVTITLASRTASYLLRVLPGGVIEDIGF